MTGGRAEGQLERDDLVAGDAGRHLEQVQQTAADDAVLHADAAARAHRVGFIQVRDQRQRNVPLGVFQTDTHTHTK